MTEETKSTTEPVQACCLLPGVDSHDCAVAAAQKYYGTEESRRVLQKDECGCYCHEKRLHDLLMTPPAPEKGGPPDAPEPVIVVGLNPEKDSVVIAIEVTGDRPLKVAFYYDLEQTKALCMSLVSLGQALETAHRERNPIVVPHKDAKILRFPGNHR